MCDLDLDLAELSRHELRVLKALSDFVTLHQPGSSLSAIDNIVLSYVVGILEDVASDDEFGIDNFIEMISAYIPGFQSIDDAVVYGWICELSGQLKTPVGDADLHQITDWFSGRDRHDQMSSFTCQLSEASDHQLEIIETSDEEGWSDADISPELSLSEMLEKEDICSLEELGENKRRVENVDEMTITASEDSLLLSELNHLADGGVPHDHSGRYRPEGGDQHHSGIRESRYRPEDGDQHQMIKDIIPDASHKDIHQSLALCGGDLEQALEMLVEKMILDGPNRTDDKSNSLYSRTTFTKPNNKDHKQRRRTKMQNDKRRRHLSREETVDRETKCLPSPVKENPENKENEHMLLELFPTASCIDAQQCLSIAKGELEVAVQLLMEKVDSGDIQRNPVMDQLPRSKVIDDKEQRELLLQKYAFVDSEEHTKEHRPFLHKSIERKKLVRYYDNKPVAESEEKCVELEDSG